jgi:hypothetical protein
MTTDYQEFVAGKTRTVRAAGFECDPDSQLRIPGMEMEDMYMEKGT